MRKEILIGSIIAVVVILFTPLSSVIAKSSMDNELVEFDIEFCGLNKKHTVKLTQQEADEIEQLFDDIEQRLSEVETREKAEIIFKEAVDELDRYGLLGGLSVRQAQRLVISNYNNLEVSDFKSMSFKRNYFCLIAGETNDTIINGPITRIIPALTIPLDFISEISENFPYLIKLIIDGILYNFYSIIFVLYGISSIINEYQPLLIGSLIQYADAEGWVWSIGLNGIKKWEGDIRAPKESYFFPIVGVFGFSGVNICINNFDFHHFYLGYANYVELNEI